MGLPTTLVGMHRLLEGKCREAPPPLPQSLHPQARVKQKQGVVARSLLVTVWRQLLAGQQVRLVPCRGRASWLTVGTGEATGQE